MTSSPNVRPSHPRAVHKQCLLILPNESVTEFLQHFESLFEVELLQGDIVPGTETTTITFQAAKNKIQALEQIIKAVLGKIEQKANLFHN